MTIWITGANGFIGRYLTRALADAGHVVDGIGHGAIDDIERAQLGLRHWLNGEIDAANLNALRAAGERPQAMFHLAGGSSVGASIVQPLEDFSRTVASTARLLDWLRLSAPDCRLIVASSAAVYGSNHAGAIGEDAQLAPMSPYGTHKLAMEQLCRSYAVTFGLRCTIARLFSVYGRHLRKQLLWDMCARLKRGEAALTLGGTGNEVRDWIEVRDVARLLIKLLENAQDKNCSIVNGGTGRGTTVAEIAQTVTRAWGGGSSVRFSGQSRAGDPFSLLADTTLLGRLAFVPSISVADGLSDYVAWARGTD